MWLNVDGARVHVLASGRPTAADAAALRAGVAEIRRRATEKPERCGPSTNTDTLRLCLRCRRRSTFQVHSICTDCAGGDHA